MTHLRTYQIAGALLGIMIFATSETILHASPHTNAQHNKNNRSVEPGIIHAPLPVSTLGKRAVQCSTPDETGVKSWAVKKAVKLLAKSIREGGDAAAKLISKLDGEAAQVFRKHSRSIADGLDKVASIPDVTIRIVREKMFYFMTKQLGIESGSAMVIVDGIDAVIWLLL